MMKLIDSQSNDSISLVNVLKKSKNEVTFEGSDQMPLLERHCTLLFFYTNQNIAKSTSDKGTKFEHQAMDNIIYSHTF